MQKLICLGDTFLKSRNTGSTDLPQKGKAFVRRGGEIDITSYTPAPLSHWWVELAKPILAMDGKTELSTAYAYIPHVSIEGHGASQAIKLPVAYSSQLNNDTTYFGSGSRQCNTTSNSMLADFLLEGELSKQAQTQGQKEAESIYMQFVSRHGDTIDHGAQTKALADLGINSYFSYTLSNKDLLSSLQAGIPVVAGFNYKASGHICLIVGHDPVKRAWLVHDPYGTRIGASDLYDVGVGGNFDLYSYETMDRIYWDLGVEAGWGRIVTDIRGAETGLPPNL